MEKIKVNDTYEYEIREIAQNENSCAIILCTENTNEVVERFKTVEKLDVYNEDGMLRESLTDYHTYSGVSYLPEYPAVKVVLKEASLEDKVAALDKKVNGTVNESSMSLDNSRSIRLPSSDWLAEMLSMQDWMLRLQKAKNTLLSMMTIRRILKLFLMQLL